MRVFLVPSWYPTRNRASWGSFILDQVAALKTIGTEVIVLHVDLKDMPSREVEHDVMGKEDARYYVSVSANYHVLYRTRYFYESLVRRYTENLELLFLQALKDWGRPSLFHAHVAFPAGIGACRIGMKYGIPVFVTEHYSGVLEDQKWWRLRCFAKELNRKATAIYAVSNWLANRMERSGVYEVRGVIPNPIDTNMFRLSTRSPSNAIRMVSVGNPSNHKGTDILLESLCLLGDSIEWNLTLFGRKDHTNNYRKWLDDPFLANRVLLPGIVDQQSLAMSYANSDMYVLSSRVETFGVSMVQAMACGLPVVATRCGGPEEIITERVGMLVTKGDAHALAEGIRKMSYHPFDAAAIRSHVVERYSLEAVGKTITSIYQENLEALKRNASIGH